MTELLIWMKLTVEKSTERRALLVNDFMSEQEELYQYAGIIWIDNWPD